RVNGEKTELVEEVVTLAKRYGITTPYTSYLVVPDAPVPVAGRRPAPGGGPGFGVPGPGDRPALLRPGEGGRDMRKVAEVVKQLKGDGEGKPGKKAKGGDLGGFRGEFEAERLAKAKSPATSGGTSKADPSAEQAAGKVLGRMKTLDEARELF